MAVVGSLLSNRCAERLASAHGSHSLPHAAEHAIRSSLGAALGVAHKLGGIPGAAISHAARTAFMSGMHLGLVTAAIVALTGAVLALATVPGKASARRRQHAVERNEG